MPVYRPVPHPLQGPQIAPLIQTGVTINAEARITTFSGVKGESAVSKAGESRISAHSRLGAESGVGKGANSVIRGWSGVAAISSVSVVVSGEARLAFYSLLRGDATVGATSFPIFDASRLTFRMDVEGRRSYKLKWSEQFRLDWQSQRNLRIVNLEMTKTGVRIDPVIIGDDFRVTRIYTGLPTGITLTKAWFTVRTTEDAPSSLIAKDISPSAGPSGHIVTAETSAGTLEMYFDPTRGETASALEATYVYDIQVKTDDDKIYTLEKGTIPFITGVTHVTS